MNPENIKLAIIGLGYVGLPLATEFAKFRSVIGFDINKQRIKELRNGFDRTNELSLSKLVENSKIEFTYDVKKLIDWNCYIITVPTPINSKKKPDLSALLSASSLVGSVLSKGNIVIYESTVYPGATEEDCAPILSKKSGLSYATRTMPNDSNVFYLGYSPERINPGDKKHRLTDIVKVISGSTPEVTQVIDDLYGSIIKAGTHKAESIRIAEAAKVIENTQRDVNIALINELAIIFKRLGIDTEAVLKAAETKWNFLSFRPGMVGGHCIGVDPYYLTHKALEIGYKPKVILAGRNINDEMPNYATKRIIDLMLNKNIKILKARILILGLSFKENCPDTRNSKVIEMVDLFNSHKCIVDIYDPLVKKEYLSPKLRTKLVFNPPPGIYDVVILAVKHKEFVNMGAKKIRQFGNHNHIFFDMKYAFNKHITDERL